MDLIPPKGWVVYGGADGADAIPDASGYIWWGDNMWIDGKRDTTFQFQLCRQKNNVSEIINLPEKCSGAGRLNWTPLGLTVGVSHQGIDKTFQISQYAQFSSGAPILVTIPMTGAAVDTQARAEALQALQEARAATAGLKTISDMVSPAKLSAMVATQVATRLSLFIHALELNDRSDVSGAYFSDVLYKKVNDWIFGWMKDHKLIKG